MEARALSPRAVRSCSVKNPEQGKEWPPAEHKLAEQFPHVKIRSRAYRRARSFTYCYASNTAEAVPIIIIVVVVAVVSLSTANPPIIGYIWNAELLRNCCNLT